MIEKNIQGQDFVEDINTYNSNKYQLRFSNFPNFTGKPIDMNIFNNYIQSLTIPDLSIPMLQSIYIQERQIHPNPIGKRDLQTIMMTFLVDETQKNWYAFRSWVYYMRHGQTCGKKDLNDNELLRLDCIDKIEVLNFDNTGTPISKMTFSNCFITNVSSIELNFSTSEISKFTVTFDIENMNLDLLTAEE